jgi:hypothetical protein
MLSQNSTPAAPPTSASECLACAVLNAPCGHDHTPEAGEGAGEGDQRPCTCRPDDNPPQPCAQKYALSECKGGDQQTGRSKITILSNGRLVTDDQRESVEICKPPKATDAGPSGSPRGNCGDAPNPPVHCSPRERVKPVNNEQQTAEQWAIETWESMWSASRFSWQFVMSKLIKPLAQRCDKAEQSVSIWQDRYNSAMYARTSEKLARLRAEKELEELKALYSVTESSSQQPTNQNENETA